MSAEDFTRSESGIRYVFGSKSHTATYVPVYLYGTGAGHIAGIMDNTQLARPMRVAFGVQNVFVITDYSGVDPEIPGVNGIDGSIWPRPRTYSLRLNVNF